MNNNDKYIISEERTILDALISINNMQGLALTLVVIDSYNQVIGTLTDGDIRRGIINGCSLEDKVTSAMRKEFSFFTSDKLDNAKRFSEYRKKGARLIPVLDEQMHLLDIVDLLKTKAMLPIDVVIMAGGKGERLRPLTEKTPKPLLPVGNKAMIDYNVEQLAAYGVNNISVTVNYLKEQLIDHFANPVAGIQVDCVAESKFLGTIGAVKLVKKFYNDIVLVMNSDIFTNIDYEGFFNHFQLHDAEMSVAAVPYTVKVPYGIFDLDGRNIQGLIEKPTYNYYANAGIYLIKRSALDEIPEDTFFNATDLIEKLISNNKMVIRYPITGYWIDIGKKEDYAKANDIVNHLNY